ncbi:hypothetical protein ANN_14983 [Periplaneta americana]|uniref:Uncharacterized protein n=1 Tax=Periplaneta americana TaxID=6978 RepID=A0ABQ8SZC1_PERAM|nr:hypothetical protein ANN_14983 [Periplaneta americana]
MDPSTNSRWDMTVKRQSLELQCHVANMDYHVASWWKLAIVVKIADVKTFIDIDTKALVYETPVQDVENLRARIVEGCETVRHSPDGDGGFMHVSVLMVNILNTSCNAKFHVFFLALSIRFINPLNSPIIFNYAVNRNWSISENNRYLRFYKWYNQYKGDFSLAEQLNYNE